MNLVKWSPFDELEALHDEINKLFEDASLFRGKKAKRNDEVLIWTPSSDIIETKDAYKIKIDIPGIPKDKIDISVSGNILAIKGERKQEKEEKDANYYRAERVYGLFQRQLTLPQNIDEENIKATYKDGVLEVVVPKKEKEKIKQITIQ